MSEQTAGSPGLQTLKIIWVAFLSSLVIYALLPLLLRLPPQTPESGFRLVLTIALGLAALFIMSIVRRLAQTADHPVNRERVVLTRLVSWSLAEAIALFGVVLYVLFHQPLHLYPFLVVAFGLLLLLAPRANHLGRPSSDLARPDVKIG